MNGVQDATLESGEGFTGSVANNARLSYPHYCIRVDIQHMLVTHHSILVDNAEAMFLVPHTRTHNVPPSPVTTTQLNDIEQGVLDSLRCTLERNEVGRKYKQEYVLVHLALLDFFSRARRRANMAENIGAFPTLLVQLQ